MSTRFYDTPGTDDTVRLLSNPLNNETLHSDEFEFSEEARINNTTSVCSACCSVLPKEINNLSLTYLDNEHPVQSTLNGDCHHCHQFKANHFHPHSSSKLILALCLCILFMAAEMVGGYIAGSVAVVSDGAHLLTDVVGFLISLIAIATSKKKNTKNFNLGFYRIGTIFLCYLISVLAAFFYLKILFFNYRYKAFTFNFSIRVSFEYLACINSNLKSKAQDVTPVTAVEILTTVTSILLIWIMTAVFIYIAAIRLARGDYIIEVNTMILISSLGVIINILMFSVLHGGCRTAHIHSHHMTVREKSKNTQSINVKAAIIHVIGDLIQSVGVFISSVVIKFFPQAKFMDPVCTFLFSIIVICSTLKLLKDSLHILMEGFPSNIEYNSILMSLQSLNGVRHVHSLCVWSLTVEKNVLIVHLAVDDAVDRDMVLFQAQRIVSNEYGINNHTIQIEKYQSKCVHACQNCRPLWS